MAVQLLVTCALLFHTEPDRREFIYFFIYFPQGLLVQLLLYSVKILFPPLMQARKQREITFKNHFPVCVKSS